MGNKNRIYPVEHAGILDSYWRKLLQNPHKFLRKYIKDGMNVLDIGCGPGFFTIPLAQLVGKKGHVVAADFQEKMLEIVEKKIQGTEIENRVRLHKCNEESTNLQDKFDFILAFYVVHETPDTEKFIEEMANLLKPEGKFLIVEPSFEVKIQDFLKIITIAERANLRVINQPRMFFSRAVLLELK
ncbi:class I SAM-dependent methyltransferase [Bacteroidetes/Chlorobi group bacterium ChocPot_Mid]|nr:MAG: class I SAM-dependent methyltransferase [Bacteroidetes/Chlorobi group bacterium ChocPot_Mid]